MKRSMVLIAWTSLLLVTRVAARAEEALEGHFLFGGSGGVVIPTGEFSEGFSAGGMGTAFFGVTGRRFGARFLFGSSEPGTRRLMNDAYSARLGRPVKVTEAIVPAELQGIAAFPAQTSRLAVVLQAGAGLHNVTIRLKGTDKRLDEDNHFGFSTGAGVRYNIIPPGDKKAMALGLNGVFQNTGSIRYYTVQLELTFVL